MKILLPVAAPVHYNPAFYLKKAFERDGHDAEVIDQTALYDHGPDDADLFVGVDSGGPLNIPTNLMHKSMMWFIDSRRNHKPEVRTPDDDIVAAELLEHGGLVFQAQRQDVLRLQSKVSEEQRIRVMWLPLAADPNVWSDQPQTNPGQKLVFVGNCFDGERHNILHSLMDYGILHWPGIEGAIMQDGAAAYRHGRIGLNIPSWLGMPECYDVNMRVFEVLSCGRPLITNTLPDLKNLGILEHEHVLTYPTPVNQQEAGDVARKVIQDVSNLVEIWVHETEKLAEMGRQSRALIVGRHTYWHRAQTILFHYNSYMS